MACIANIVFSQDVERRRLLWRASCACGWESALASDSTCAVLAAEEHDGRRATLLERPITQPGPRWRQ